MINISQVVEEILTADDVALAAAQRGWLNLSAYARCIRPEVQAKLLKNVQEGSIITALSRLAADMPKLIETPADSIQGLAVHSNLEGMTYERSAEVSAAIRDIYSQIHNGDKTFLTVTQGMNEITIVAQTQIANVFRTRLQAAHKIYDKAQLVGISVKFKVDYIEIPNLIFALSRRLAYKNINIIEIVSTATELTYIIEKTDLAAALEQLQKDM